MSKKERVTKKKHTKKTRDSGLTHSDYDEVDHFHTKKDQILLEDNNEDIIDSDEADYNPDTILDIPENNNDDDDEELFENGQIAAEDTDDHNWGRGRKNYYSNDKDEKEEVEEAERLYKKKLSSMTPEDFGLSAAKGTSEKKTVTVKSVSFDSSDSDEPEQQTDNDKIEDELENAVNEVKSVLQPFIEKVSSGKFPRSEGLSFLQTKYNLLLHYCINAVYYVKSRASGKPLSNDHPVLERLIKYRMLIEKTKPLEAKLKYQIDRLLKAANDPSQETTEEQIRPHTDLIRADNEGADQESEAGVNSEKYRPPKLQHMEMLDPKKEDKKRQTRIQSDLQKEEHVDQDAPEEEENDPVRRVGSGKNSKNRFTGTTDNLDDVEEENFVRFQLSKKDKHKLAEQSKIIDGLDDLNDMFDEFDRRRPSKRSMDDDGADVVIKGRSKKNAKKGDSDSEIESGSASEGENYYEAVKAQKKAKRDHQSELKDDSKQRVHFRDIADMDSGKPRRVSRSILTNRGLTPSRPKDTKNPRVKQRKRFEKASKRLGSFKPVGSKSSGPYAGEATGIRTNISRSHKF